MIRAMDIEDAVLDLGRDLTDGRLPASRILSLPVQPELSQEQLEWVASAIHSFYSDGGNF